MAVQASTPGVDLDQRVNRRRPGPPPGRWGSSTSSAAAIASTNPGPFPAGGLDLDQLGPVEGLVTGQGLGRGVDLDQPRGVAGGGLDQVGVSWAGLLGRGHVSLIAQSRL